MRRPLASARLELRVPPAEKAAIADTAREHGISMSAYLRIVTTGDIEQRHRQQLRKAMYPDKQ